MKSLIKPTLMLLALSAGLSCASLRAADSAAQAAAVKEKIQNLRAGSAEGRNQVTLTLEALNRMLAPGVELRPQFEKYKAELAKMEQLAARAKERAAEMKQKGEAFFADYEAQVASIQNEDIRKEAASRLAKRKKSYDRIIAEMQDAKEQLGPFLSDLNDIKTLLDSELTATSVSKTKSVIKKANWHGTDVRDALSDVEKELDRVSAELATYQ